MTETKFRIFSQHQYLGVDLWVDQVYATLVKGTIRKISVITYSLIKNHGFVDGNKRVGVATMLLLLKLNGIIIKYSQEEFIQLGLKTAEGIYAEEDIEQWILQHQV